MLVLVILGQYSQVHSVFFQYVIYLNIFNYVLCTCSIPFLSLETAIIYMLDLLYLSLILVTFPQNLFIFFTSLLFKYFFPFTSLILLRHYLLFFFLLLFFPSSLVFIPKILFLFLILSWVLPLILGVSNFIMLFCHALYHFLFNLTSVKFVLRFFKKYVIFSV